MSSHTASTAENKRSTHLLVLLVVMPLVLLAWLGLSLHDQGEKRLRDAAEAMAEGRLGIISHMIGGMMNRAAGDLRDWARAELKGGNHSIPRPAWVTSWTLVSQLLGPSAPGWRVLYMPAPGKMPTAQLFPILLGAASGCVLVPALAWILFRENRRELDIAQQRVSFVNQVSHEVRTPLTNIRLYVEMLQARMEGKGDERAMRQLAVVEAETARLTRLIQNVLSFAMR
jgi:signal transduction histidine kinase